MSRERIRDVDLPEVDARVRAAIEAKKLPGSVVAIGRRSGLVFLRAFGERAVYPERESTTVDAVFALASLTKRSRPRR